MESMMMQCSVYAFEQFANATVDEIFDFGKYVYVGIDVCNSVIIWWQLHMVLFQVCVMCHLDWFQALVH